MGYRKFSTENAHYVLKLGFHKPTSVTAREIFEDYGEGVDAVMLEIRGSSSLLKAHNNREALEKILQKEIQKEDSELIEYCREKEIQVYALDPEQNMTDDLKARAGIYLKEIPKLLSAGRQPIKSIFEYAMPNKHIEVQESAMKRYDKLVTRSQNPMGEGRNAVWARKLEEYVALRLREKTGRKPRIGLNIGAAHIGVERDLKHPVKRNFFLKRAQKKNYSCFNDGHNIGAVYEATYCPDKGWSIEMSESGLF